MYLDYYKTINPRARYHTLMPKNFPSLPSFLGEKLRRILLTRLWTSLEEMLTKWIQIKEGWGGIMLFKNWNHFIIKLFFKVILFNSINNQRYCNRDKERRWRWRKIRNTNNINMKNYSYVVLHLIPPISCLRDFHYLSVDWRTLNFVCEQSFSNSN